MEHPHAVMLDKHAIQSLNRLGRQQGAHGFKHISPYLFNASDYREIDAGIGACLEFHNQALNEIVADVKDPTSRNAMLDYLANIPIAIGPEAYKYTLNGAHINA